MIKKILVPLAVAAAITITALGQQKFIADKVVAVVGNSPILYSDVVKHAEEVTAEYRSMNYTSPREPLDEAMEVLLEQKLLFNQAQIDSVDVSRYMSGIAEMVDHNLDQMIAQAGSVKALETQKRKPLYSIREDMRGEIEEYYYAVEMRNTIQRQVKVTPGEVDRFYRKIDKDSLPIVPEQYVYAQITKLPKTTEQAKQRARERLLELRQRIIDGERFDRLAVMYSRDDGSAIRGGEMDPAPKESFVEPFANALVKLKPGQVSGIVETEFGFHIIQLIDKSSDDLYHMRHILIKPSYTTEELTGTLSVLDSIAGSIRNGDTTFEKAAIANSDDEASRMNGGLVSNQQFLYRHTGSSDPSQTSTHFFKDNLDPNDFRYLGRLKPGEMSQSFVGTDMLGNQMGKMLKLIEIIPAHKANLAQDYLLIEQMALERKKQAHYTEWLNKKIDEMYVRIDPMFSKEDFKNQRWFK